MVNIKRTAQKEFKFEAAHRLINYAGKCKNLHGHSYLTKVVLALRENAPLDPNGFVMDYGGFAPLKEWIDENIDHSTIVSLFDIELCGTLSALNSKAFVIEKPNTSAEYLCEVIYEQAKRLLESKTVYVCKVIVNETCTSEATISL